MTDTFDIIDKNDDQFIKPEKYKNTNQSNSINRFDIYNEDESDAPDPTPDTNLTSDTDTDTDTENESKFESDIENESDSNCIDLFVLQYNGYPTQIDCNKKRLNKTMIDLALDYVDILTSQNPSHDIRLSKTDNGFNISKSFKYSIINYEENIINISVYKVKSNLKNAS